MPTPLVFAKIGCQPSTRLENGLENTVAEIVAYDTPEQPSSLNLSLTQLQSIQNFNENKDGTRPLEVGVVDTRGEIGHVIPDGEPV